MMSSTPARDPAAAGTGSPDPLIAPSQAAHKCLIRTQPLFSTEQPC
jgi:hypothetical protein